MTANDKSANIWRADMNYERILLKNDTKDSSWSNILSLKRRETLTKCLEVSWHQKKNKKTFVWLKARYWENLSVPVQDRELIGRKCFALLVKEAVNILSWAYFGHCTPICIVTPQSRLSVSRLPIKEDSDELKNNSREINTQQLGQELIRSCLKHSADALALKLDWPWCIWWGQQYGLRALCSSSCRKNVTENCNNI